jgi:hypothetical protein
MTSLKLEMVPRTRLVPYAGNTRVHSKKQITKIASALRKFGFVNPILTGPDNTVIVGHGRLLAAELLGMDEVPTIVLGHLTAAERRAYAIADNRLAELSHFDLDLLSIELKALDALELDFPLEITGFEGAQLDAFLDPTPTKIDPADQVPEASGPPVTRLGDVWRLGKHRLICGDARASETYTALMAGEPARMVFTDPPYNVPIDGHVGGKGKIARRDFVTRDSRASCAMVCPARPGSPLMEAYTTPAWIGAPSTG